MAKNKISLWMKIMDFIHENYNENHEVNTIDEIAEGIYGEACNVKEARSILEDSIRRNMAQTIQKAYEFHGIYIIPARKQCKNDAKAKSRIIGYKEIAPNDKDLLIDEHQYKKKAGDSRYGSGGKLLEAGKMKGVLSEKEVKKLKGD